MTVGSLRVALLVWWGIGLAAPALVGADAVTHEDVAACNSEARDAIQPGSAARGSALPNTGDRDRATQSQLTETSTASPGVASGDAQLDGMDRDGAKDPAYQAAFRGCMRRKGF